MQPSLALQDDQEHLPSLLATDAKELSYQLQQHQAKIFPPLSQKTIRTFSPAEAAAFIGIGEGYLRQVAADGHGPDPLANGRRLYSATIWIESAGSLTRETERRNMCRPAGRAKSSRSSPS